MTIIPEARCEMTLSKRQYNKYCDLIKNKLGVHLTEHKLDMIQGKLTKLMKNAGVNCYDQYYNIITQENSEHWPLFVDKITIHKTNFFREDNHFNFIKQNIDKILETNKRIFLNREIRVWSSACSTGEEAYTLAMVFKEHLPKGINIKILATDISPGVIKEAQKGEYVLDSEDLINSYYVSKYFTKMGTKYKISRELQNYISFRTFNLINPFPFKNKFDVIFCRNVMIYFDNPTQERLVNKFYHVTAGKGLLFIGHSESLNQKTHNFKYIQPTIYTRT